MQEFHMGMAIQILGLAFRFTGSAGSTFSAAPGVGKGRQRSAIRDGLKSFYKSNIQFINSVFRFSSKCIKVSRNQTYSLFRFRSNHS